MITLDTSAVVALGDRRDPRHRTVAGIIESEDGPHIAPAPVLAEMSYMLAQRAGPDAPARFADQLARGALAIDCCDDDFARVHELIARYDDLPLGFADAVVIACGERNGGRILTLDRRDFDVVARGEGTVTLLP